MDTKDLLGFLRELSAWRAWTSLAKPAALSLTRFLGIVLNPNEPKEMAEAERLNQRLVHRALSLGGTCTGEHGIGGGKIDFLSAEHGEAVSASTQ